jgi:hypothetical protein
MVLSYNQYQVNNLDSNSGEQIMNKELSGFVNTDCDIVENILLGILRLAVNEKNIFDNNRLVNLNSLYNSVVYDRY